jgi:hypothetical protein
MTPEEMESLEQELARLREENAALKAKKAAGGGVYFRVTQPREPGTHNPTDKGSKGGAVAVYGLGRFPFTFWKSQARAFIKEFNAFVKFVEDNDALLTEKE